MSDIEQPMPVSPPSRWQGGRGYGSGGQSSGHRAAAGRDHHAVDAAADVDVSLSGVDPASVTPEVQHLLDGVMAELDNLRWQLEQSHHRQVYLETLADQDACLPALNRRAFLRDLGRFLDRAGPDAVAGALGVLYLDNFDVLRREVGLAVAMDALEHLVRSVATALRETDLIGAIGGAGIAVLMSTARPEAARAKLDALAAALSRQPLTRGGLRLSLSPVVVLYDLHVGDTAESALAAAEALLLRAD
jgi:GGDEF domain-containing protein